MKLLFLFVIMSINTFNSIFAMKQTELTPLQYDIKSNGIYTNSNKLITFNENKIFLFDQKAMLFKLHKTLPFSIIFSIPYIEDYYLLSKNNFCLLKDGLIAPIQNSNHAIEKKLNYTNVKFFNDKLFLIAHDESIIDIYDIKNQKFTTIEVQRKPIDVYFDEKTNSLFVLATDPSDTITYLIKYFGNDFKNNRALFLGRTIPYEIEGNILSYHQDKLYALLKTQIKIVDIKNFDIVAQINCSPNNAFLVNNIQIDNEFLYCSYCSNPEYLNENEELSDDEQDSENEVIDDHSVNNQISENIIHNNQMLETEADDVMEEEVQVLEKNFLYLPLIDDETEHQTILDVIDLKKNKHFHRILLKNCMQSFLIFDKNLVFEMSNAIECIPKWVSPVELITNQTISTLFKDALSHLDLAQKTNLNKIEQKLFNQLIDYQSQFMMPSVVDHLFKREISHHTPQIFKDSARTMNLYERAIILSKLVNNLNWGIFKKASNYMNFLMKRGNTPDCFAFQLANDNDNNLINCFAHLALSEGTILEEVRIEKRIIFLNKFFEIILKNQYNLIEFKNTLKKTLCLDKVNHDLFTEELTKCYILLKKMNDKEIFKNVFILPFLDKLY